MAEVLAPVPAVQELLLAQRVQELELRPALAVRALRLAPAAQELELSLAEAELELRPVAAELRPVAAEPRPLEAVELRPVAARALSQQKVAVAEIRLEITVSHPDRVAALLAVLDPREAQPKRLAVAEAPA